MFNHFRPFPLRLSPLFTAPRVAMLKLFGNGGSQSARSVHVGKTYRVSEHQVTVEDVIAEGEPRAGRFSLPSLVFSLCRRVRACLPGAIFAWTALRSEACSRQQRTRSVFVASGDRHYGKFTACGAYVMRDPPSVRVHLQKALSDCPHSVTYVSSAVHRLDQGIYEVLILMDLYTGEGGWWGVMVECGGLE